MTLLPAALHKAECSTSLQQCRAVQGNARQCRAVQCRAGQCNVNKQYSVIQACSDGAHASCVMLTNKLGWPLWSQLYCETHSSVTPQDEKVTQSPCFHGSDCLCHSVAKTTGGWLSWLFSMAYAACALSSAQACMLLSAETADQMSLAFTSRSYLNATLWRLALAHSKSGSQVVPACNFEQWLLHVQCLICVAK